MKLIVDGHNIAHRIAHTQLRLNSRYDAQPTEIVYNFLRMMRAAADFLSPEGIMVVFDSQRRNQFRTKIYPDYKIARRKNRSLEEEESWTVFMGQIMDVRGLLETHLGIPCLAVYGVEADDLIYHFTYGVWPHEEVIIYSADTDFFQLLSRRVKVYTGKELMTVKWLKEKHGVTPDEYLAAKVLSGDTTDSIPPVVPGMGPKTARSLVKTYRSFKRILELAEAGELRDGKRRLGALSRAIAEDSDQVRKNMIRNKKLIDLREHPGLSDDVVYKINCLMETTIRRGIEPEALQSYFFVHGMASLLTEFNQFLMPFVHAHKAWEEEWKPIE